MSETQVLIVGVTKSRLATEIAAIRLPSHASALPVFTLQGFVLFYFACSYRSDVDHEVLLLTWCKFPLVTDISLL